VCFNFADVVSATVCSLGWGRIFSLGSGAETSTIPMPQRRIPSELAAASDRSISDEFDMPPRSLIITWTFLPFARLVTSTVENNGNEVCAAVNLRLSKISPLLVRCPLC